MVRRQKFLTRKQIKEGIIDILWYDLIDYINSLWSTSSFFRSYNEEQYSWKIILWTDLTDWYSNWITINSYLLVQRDFWDIDYDQYELIWKAIDFLTNHITDPKTWDVRISLIKFTYEDLSWFSIDLDISWEDVEKQYFIY